MTDLRKRLRGLITRSSTCPGALLAIALLDILDGCDAADAEGCATLNVAWLEAVIERAVEDR